MEIISKGRLPKDQQYQTTCNNCRTIFTFMRDEAELVPDSREGDFLRVTCPLPGCGSKITAGIIQPNYGR